MEKFLIVKGCAGLGNRLITLANAIDYAKETNRTIYVDWKDGQFAEKGVNAFDKYFKLKGIKQIESIKNLDIQGNNSYPSLWGNHPFQNLYDLYTSEGSGKLKYFTSRITKGKFSQLSYGYWQPVTIKNVLIKNKEMRAMLSIFNKDSMPRGGNYSLNINMKYLFFADYSPLFSEQTFLKHIHLKDNIKEEIENLAKKLDVEKCVGIHVRMTDKQPNASLESIIQLIKKKHKNEPIFLATDNPYVENIFQKCFSKIRVSNKNLPSFDISKKGIHKYAIDLGKEEIENMFKQSIIDIWLLSKCKVMYYQSNSTFSLVSSIIKREKNSIFNW